ncbi:MAG: MFS transporter [Pseudomonadota bacterium]
MLTTIATLASLLVAAALLYAGNGLQGTLLAVRGGGEGFSPPVIGALMSAYYFGFIVGCRVVPRYIANIGHIRSFVALASVASASALAHAIFVEPYSWGVLRAITGFAFAGMAMVLESWINERSSNANRGRVLSIYRIVDLSALTLGNLLLAAASPAGFELFALVSILISLALVPIAMTRIEAPPPVTQARLDLRGLYRVSPVAAAGALGTGLANAAFWGVAPLFVQSTGCGADTVGTFMSAAIVAAGLSQLPIGVLSDRIDRRIVLCAAALLAGCGAALLAIFGQSSVATLVLLGAALGMFMLPVFGLSLAHAADHAAKGQSVGVSGSMLLLHGMGAVVGAVLGGAAMSLAGGAGLFGYIATIEIALAAFALSRIAKRAAPENKSKHRPAPRSPSTVVYSGDNKR